MHRLMYPRISDSLSATIAAMFFVSSLPNAVFGALESQDAVAGSEISNAIAPRADSTSSIVAGLPVENTNAVRSFRGVGVVRDIPLGGKALVVRHEEIPGFMPSMTMEFTVRDPAELKGIKVGDTVTFHVLANEEESWIEEIHQSRSPLAPALEPIPNLSELGKVAELKDGDVLPDFTFLTEDGRTLHFSDFEGHAVAFTFIFTRCPMPEFCPRMSHGFASARELLQQANGGPTNWQFLSLSFDPEFDRPEVLAAYARNYRGAESKGWLFAVLSTNVLASLESKLDFRVTRDNGALVHNLRTVVLDPQRRIYRQFKGNQWKPAELAQALVEAARLGAR
jgi:protein SCO1/2